MALDVNKTPFLYSMGTYIAYRISKQYYNNVHYTWCTEKFHSDSQPAMSDPQTRGNRFLLAVKTGDRHSNEIIVNISGILKGARAKRKDKTIKRSEYKLIRQMVNSSSYDDFFPILYIIKTEAVKDRCIEVKKEEKANDNSVEYLIKDLSEDEFEIITYKELLSGFFRASNRKVVIKNEKHKT